MEIVKEFVLNWDETRLLKALFPGENPASEEMHRILADLLPRIRAVLSPQAALAFGRLEGEACGPYPEGTPVLYEFLTVGRQVSRLIEEYFDSGRYLAGLLADTLAGDSLFQMDDSLIPTVKEVCERQGFSIRRREEPPGGLPLAVHRLALEQTGAGEALGLRLTDGLMFLPEKTLCQVYVLGEGGDHCRIGHDCSHCENTTCHRRSGSALTVIWRDGGRSSLWCKSGQSILECMAAAGFPTAAVCGGRGICGRCRIRLLAGELPPTPQEEGYLKAEELSRGCRLACMARPQKSCIVQADFLREAGMETISRSSDGHLRGADYGLAVDIGTTTIAMELIEIPSGQRVGSWAGVNRQRAFGADVVSRIAASNRGDGRLLRETVRQDIRRGWESLQKELSAGPCRAEADPGHTETDPGRAEAEPGRAETRENPITLSRIAVAGNTAMLHLLLGYSCQGLGAYPFSPESLSGIEGDGEALLGPAFCGIPVTILPGLSAFVGADITAGLLALCADQDVCDARNPFLFLDLGTNGEMALFTGQDILTASTAVGPAFEGGSLSCGLASIPGAISHVRIVGRRVSVETIGGRPAEGICGSGMVDAVADMVKNGILDENGTMREPYRSGGLFLGKDSEGQPISVTQEDVRQLQLAKAAVRAGADTLLNKAGLGVDELMAVYVAGGFGCKMDMEKAVGIGLLPGAFRGKMKAVGNSVLKGLSLYLCLPADEALKRVGQIADSAKEITLANEEAFQGRYVEQMVFPSAKKETI